MKREEIYKRLLLMKEQNYKEFNSKLIPTVDPELVIGVRVPDIRKLAREVVKGDFRTYISELKNVWQDDKNSLFYEEGMLFGMIVGICKAELDEKFSMTRDFVPIIDNWATCDVCCGDLKFADRNQEEAWEFLQEYLDSDQEYYVRFGVVMLLGHYINSSYIDRVLTSLNEVRLVWPEGKNEHNIPYGYYVKMAVAWAVSVCYAKFPEKTLPYIKENKLDDFTHNKAIQKIRESYRVAKEDKDYLKTFKR